MKKPRTRGKKVEEEKEDEEMELKDMEVAENKLTNVRRKILLHYVFLDILRMFVHVHKG